MDLIITIFAFLILIAIIVAIHEGGHYVAALWCRIKVLEFSLGFGPKIFEKKLNQNLLCIQKKQTRKGFCEYFLQKLWFIYPNQSAAILSI